MTLLRIDKFRSELLDNERDIYIYLPPGYSQSSERRYPVLYLHDGQNVFHPGYNGQSWNLHRIADRLIAEGRIGEIVMVGAANMETARADEYTHALEGVDYARDKMDITPKGELYERFLIEELKPYIDAVLRTKTGPAHTGLLGSSRGGQVTYHIGMRRADVFGMIGIMSPYLYYVNPDNLAETRVYARFKGRPPLRKIWIDTGGKEGTLILEKHVRGLVDELLAAGYEPNRQLAYYFDPEAAHTEADWEARAALPLLHFFGQPGELADVSLQPAPATALHGPDAVGRFVPAASYAGGLRLTPLGGGFAATGPAEGVARVDDGGIVRGACAAPVRAAYSFEGRTAQAVWPPGE
ncbi:alpha/beta hydrolase [Cohnella rhizosphaerae]|uniref:Alpha/beta hydrolase-fold protein n=1 Tax=Cohnella rhizosphaerae TaxID=1457232 RepID=A0A9X4KXL4_9BACL|nr:alpha/beta hydrolase-fold protein [Cohnella rhizosphaerae]MDG0810144.1 alpha/beta hydrolase-fold protein [Cohnella rhizosphaerae]